LEWMMNILLARVSPHYIQLSRSREAYDLHLKSWVSYQGRRPQSKPTGASLSRAGTRRAPNKPGQTLVSIPPPTVQSVPNKPVFEPGSLLATRMM
jgi:hypothetical protein